jgi:polyisoprenoid-binding protein YceI
MERANYQDHDGGSGDECPKARDWARELFSNNAAYLLNDAAQSVRAAFGSALEPLAISPRQVGVLEVLARREPMRQQEIGALLGIDRTSVVAVIDELEQRGYVVRQADPTDRRAYALRLTEAGRSAAATGQAALTEAQRRFLEPLSKGEWDTLRELLRKLASRTKEKAHHIEETTMATTYQLDPAHSSARFSVRHMMISHVRGDFSDISGMVDFDASAPQSSKISVEIGVASVNTGQPQRDGHLITADFFDTDKYPKITFVSKSGTRTGDETAKIVGDLTIHGVTKEVTLDVEGMPAEVKDMQGNYRMGFTGHTRIKRGDFGLTYNAALETGGVLIGDDIDITVDAQFVRPA